MKVLMTADPLGGVWSYALELMRALAPDGVTFELATMGAPLHDEQRRQIRQLPHVRLHESTFLLEWMPDAWADVDRAGDWLLELHAKLSPDVVHLNGYVHAALPWHAPTIVVAHSCVLSWWQAVKRAPPPPSFREYHRRVQEGLFAAGLVIAPTHAMLQSILRNYGALPRVGVIANARTAGRYRLLGKDNVIAAVGRIWDEGKNIHALARTASLLDWPVFIAGDDGGQPLTDVAPSVSLLGVLSEPEVARLLGRAAIYALPARYEPFGLSILEAAHCGCALVLGDIPSLRENWQGAALFVDAFDDQALARALRQLTGDASAREKLGRLAQQRAQRFAPRAAASAYLNSYIELALNHSPRGQSCAS